MKIYKKYLLFANEKNNRWTSAVLFKLETAFHWECRGALKGNMLTVYTFSYIPSLSRSDCSIIRYSINQDTPDI